MKRLIAVLAVLTMITAVLAGCEMVGSAQQNNLNSATSAVDTGKATESTEKSSRPVTLNYTIFGSDANKKMYNDMTVKFKEKYPNVDVEVRTVPWGDYQQKITIEIAANQAPDMAWLAEDHIPQFMYYGLLADITEFKDDPEYNFEDIYTSVLSLVTKDNRLYGIPFSTPPIMIVYNKTLFKEKNLKTPMELYKEGKWNYDEFLKAAIAITDKSKGIYGVSIVSDWAVWSTPIYALLRANGGEVLSEDGQQFLLNSPEGEKTLQFFSDLIFKHNVHPMPGDVLNLPSGKVGMSISMYSGVNSAQNIKDFEWGIAPMPEGEKGNGVWNGYAGISIFKSSKEPEMAKEYLKFITSTDGFKVSSKFFVPCRKSVLESDEFLNQYANPSADDVKVTLLDQLEKSSPKRSHPQWTKINDAIKIGFDMIYTQSATVKEALEKMEKDVNAILNAK